MSITIGRRALAGAALGALALPRLASAQAREFVIVSFAGQLQEPHQWLARRMEARHPGLRIRLVPSEAQDIVAQIKAAQGASPFDAMPNGEPPHLTAQREGYIQRLDPARVPNAANVVPEFMAKSNGFGVPASYSLVGLAYNTRVVRREPASWEDLWHADYRGKVAIPRASSNLGLAVIAIVAKVFGGAEDNLAPAWERLAALRPVVGRSPTALIQLLEREEIGIAPIWNNDAAGAAARGLPIRFAQPAPGPVSLLSFMSAITNTRHPDLANEWMNDILSTEYQQRAADAPYFFGPTVRGVAVPEAARAYTPTTPAEVARLQSVDWQKIAPVRGQILEQFDRTFGG
jgi:putative spermidine/putrescine transport system substrate-binding protein